MFCPVYKQCGACSYLNEDYAKQIQKKQRVLQSLYPNQKVLPFLGDEHPEHYRHKIYASFGQSKKGIFLGLYGEKSHKLANSKDCCIQSELGNEILKTIARLANQFHLSVYQEDKQRGLLRHVYLRIRTDERGVMCVLVLGEPGFPGSKNFVKSLVQCHPEIETVILNFNNRKTSVVLGNQERVAYGSGYILEEMAGLKFRISSHSFYQVNPRQALKLYQKAMELAQLKKGDTVIDACCGTGTISLLLAKQVKEVIGIELNPQAVRDANENKKHNGISNVRFLQGRVEEVMVEKQLKGDVLFLDPPRSGMGKEFMRHLSQLNIPKIIYISCNPNTQARDIQVIQKEYQIEAIQGVDLFPQTPHLECIVLMSKVN